MRTTIEHAGRAGERDHAHIVIETVEDYELATRRIAALDKSIRGTSEDCELEALLEAVKQWDRRHDDATGWKDRP
ncbi:hypothetical protein ASE63_06315 [Bosea sp. Root381]|uniref:hypothetical protein n=1 Tax=Bosea sp. Root381 TaxID=1736524 RepID=UPI0006FF15FB|nr:hypothetical protein [Bosea sp. Root381]KRE05924.1 hypothetical protein ASE63_06315 [Bosea sp. Root381]